MIPGVLIFRTLLLTVLLPATAGAADSDPVQDIESIRETARQFAAGMAAATGADSRVEAGPVDRRLRLPLCDKPLTASAGPAARTSGSTTVGVRCDGTSPWALYVPVSIKRPAQVVLTTRPMARGETIVSSDIYVAERDVAGLHRGYLNDVSQAIGRVLRRDAPADEPINPGMLGAATVIERGATVSIVAANPLMDVRMRGTALAAGTIGERIRVRNQSSRRELDAIVVDAGTVQVSP
jgi:flagella basal body P-ring formation protein FlgA